MVELESIISKLITIVIFLNVLELTDSVMVKFTKFECSAFDKPFADIPKCQLKVLARNIVGLNIHVRLHKIPVTNVSVNAGFYFKDSTQRYQPLMYNTTVDFCKFLINPNKVPFWKIFFNVIKPASNINHTCPFDHDIIVRNLVLDSQPFKMIPFPSGEYLIEFRVMAYNDLKAEIRSYFVLRE